MKLTSTEPLSLWLNDPPVISTNKDCTGHFYKEFVCDVYKATYDLLTCSSVDTWENVINVISISQPSPSLWSHLRDQYSRINHTSNLVKATNKTVNSYI